MNKEQQKIKISDENDYSFIIQILITSKKKSILDASMKFPSNIWIKTNIPVELRV